MTLQLVPAWLPEWLVLLPMVAAMVSLWFGSSYFWLRIARIPAVVALAVAPAITTSLIWALSLIWEAAGLFWSGARVLPVLAFISLSGAVLYVRLRRKGRLAKSPDFRARAVFLPSVAATSAACLVGWILGVLPMLLAAPPDNPVQQWDPTFHMNGVWSITQNGVAAPGEGLAANYGGAKSKEYPIGWHAFTSLFATGPTTVQASNASSLALIAVWIIAMSAMVRFLFPSRIASLAAPILAAVWPSMPADAFTAYQQTPNAMSVVLLPGIASIGILAGRQLVALFEGRASRWRDWFPTVMITLIALWGGVQAHPVVAFNLLILLGPAAIAGAATLLAWSVRNRRFLVTAVVSAGTLATLALVVLVQFTPQVESMRNYKRGGVNLKTAISQVLVPTPPFPTSLGVPITSSMLTVLAVTGSVWIILALYTRKPWARWTGAVKPVAWPIWSWGLFLALNFVAYGPNWPIRKWIVGPWFSDGRRIMEPMAIPLVMLAAVGFQFLVVTVSRMWSEAAESQREPLMDTTRVPRVESNRSVQTSVSLVLGGILLLASLGGGLDGRLAAARSVMDPARLGKPGMATQGVLDMMRSLPELLPEDAVVLGDPQAGAAYAQMIGQRRAFFPQLTFLNHDGEAQEVILQRFNQINTDPSVCEVVREAGITHFYQYPDGYYYTRLRGDRAPGLYNVDTSQGFELVAEGDDARLYRITACD